MNIGDIIKQRRTELNLTLEDIGNSVGVARSTVKKWENGNIENMKRDKISLLAKVLRLNPVTFITGDLIGVSYEIKEKGVKIPVLGVVRAGLPIETVENIIDYEEISNEMANQGEFFGLRITGDSMEPRIKEGDTVIVRKQNDVDSGDTAIVLINGEDATIKKIKKYDGGIALVPNNLDKYDVKTYSADEIQSLPVSIIGKVVELRAKF